MSNSILSIKNLTVEYTSNKEIIHAINDVSFEVEKGTTLGLVGETGAGKTTIAKSILRVLPDPPARIKNGEIWFDGQDLMQFGKEEMRRIRGSRISMIFQDPMTSLNPTMRVADQIADGIRRQLGLSKKESQHKAVEMLEMVGIPRGRARDYPHQFSGGMKQRVIIAIALACSPDLLLADEPTSALDVTIQAQILDMISELKEKHGTSMILITHDLGVVAETCDNVAIIYAGEIVEFGDKYEIFDHPSHPYTIGLFGALPDIESDEERLKPMTGLMPSPTEIPPGCSFFPRCPYASEECNKAHVELRHLEGTHTCRCLKEGRLDVKQEVDNVSIS